MRIPTNHIYSIINFFHSELDDAYGKNEVDSFIKISFETILSYSSIQLSLNKNETVSESVLLKFNNVVKKLRFKNPIQYIFQESYFYDLKLYVDENVLIPRPETEELVDWIVKDNLSNNQFVNILDIGTGSGAIALSLKNNLPNSNVNAWDISEKALDVATQNAKSNNLEIDFKLVDVLKLNEIYSTKFDIIVSNPPYVLNKEKELMNENVLNFEPELALFVEDNDPLIFYREILKLGKTMLNDKGLVYFEINEAFGNEMINLCKTYGYSDVEIRKDFAGKDRMIKAVLNK